MLFILVTQPLNGSAVRVWLTTMPVLLGLCYSQSYRLLTYKLVVGIVKRGHRASCEHSEEREGVCNVCETWRSLEVRDLVMCTEKSLLV